MSRLPRTFTNRRVGNRCRSCAIRRTLPVPIRGRTTATLDVGLMDSGPTRQHERVPRIFALEHRADLEPVGQQRRHVLAAVHGEIDVAAEQRVLDFLHEEPLAADVRQRGFLQAVARRLDDDDLAAPGRRPLDALGDEPGLKERELTSSAAEAKRVHCAGFFVVRDAGRPWSSVPSSAATRRRRGRTAGSARRCTPRRCRRRRRTSAARSG